MDENEIEELFDELQGLGSLRSRRMFGGVGLYCDDVFFAVIAQGLLYFKVDGENRDAYLKCGARAFPPGVQNPTEEARLSATYYEVPPEIQERRADFLSWARGALGAAKRKSVKRKPKPQAPARSRPVGRLLNLGRVSSGWLESVGIHNQADLEQAGSVGAYLGMLENGIKPNLNLLYALEGALMELNIIYLPAVIKDSLRERVTQAARRKKA